MSCTNSRNLIKKNYFSTADGLHFIRGGIDISDEVFFHDEVWFHFSGYVNTQRAEYGVLCISDVTADTLHRVASNMRKE
jgi:hypothetical protein